MLAAIHSAASGATATTPYVAFYQAAASVFAVLLLTGVAGEMRDLRERIEHLPDELPRTVRRNLVAVTVVLLAVLLGEFISLVVLLHPPTASWAQIPVAICLGISIPGIPAILFVSLWDGRVSDRRVRELQGFVKGVLVVVVVALAGAALLLLGFAIANSPGHSYHVYGTCATGECGLKERSEPSTESAQAGRLDDGDSVDVVCQIPGKGKGGKVTAKKGGASSETWDKLADGSYVTDLFVDTPRVGDGIPACPEAREGPARSG
ncbi:MAG: hypothetical protein JWO14_2629 [Solirubrobacterales bacterium]|nr:hypothetical protein [Solirubrobacterales bacterium]